MHGLVLMQLKKHVETAYGGPATWSALLVAAGLPGRIYTAMGEYPDEEVVALVGAACSATGKDAATVLEGFGRALAPGLLETYAFLVPEHWDAFDVVANTETSIHTVVRAREAGAAPPVLQVARLAPDRLTITYASGRRLCALARGIVLGIGDRYGTPLAVVESSCMHRGAARCVLDVTPARAALPPLPRPAVEPAPERSVW